MGFEHEIREYLKDKDIDYIDYSNGYDTVDFGIKFFGDSVDFRIEAKKKGKFVKKNWSCLNGVKTSEEDLLMDDEMSIRRMLSKGPYVFLLVKDTKKNRYFVMDLIDIFFSEKIRCNRDMGKGLKGKWIWDVTGPWITICPTLDCAFEEINKKRSRMAMACGITTPISHEWLPCFDWHGLFDVPICGMVRTESHRMQDREEEGK